MPAAAALHATEVALGIGGVGPGVQGGDPGGALAGVALIVAMPIGIALVGDLRRQGGPALFAMLAFQAAMPADLAGHLATTTAGGAPAPGLWTSLFIGLPLTLWILGRAWRESWLGRAQLAWIPAAGLALYGAGRIGLRLAEALIGS